VDEALAGFQALQAAAGSGYRDVSSRILAIRTAQAKAQTLETLYAQAEEAQVARQWDRILDLLARIQELSPGYRGVDTLLEKHRHLEDLYRRAMTAMAARKWAAALTALHQLQALEPEYRDLTSLLERTQEGLDAEVQMAERYSRAQAALAGEDWAGAAALLEEIVAQHDAYRDAVDLLRQAREKLTVPCWNCGNPLPPDRKFCGKCGSPREEPALVVCPECAYKSPVGKKFCGRCGTRLPLEKV
jgi:hypothetical protein